MNPSQEQSRFRYHVSTMGCKANLTDSQALESRLRALGGAAAAEEDADLFVLNTCTVTDQADKEARSILKKSKAALTVAAGCLAEVAPESFASLVENKENKFLVLRNSAKEDVASVIESWLADTFSDQKSIVHGDRVRWHENVDFVPGAAEETTRTRAFLKVQDGCNAFCSYCIIPRARGRSRSVAPFEIVQEVNRLHEAGMKEVVLTAIHAADYDFEGMDFTGLVEKVLQETKIPRVRLTSLDPAEIPDRLVELMEKNPRLCPHFHVSLQSANTRVLQAMKRGYDAVRVEECLEKIAARLPHAFVGMDMIAGFPGESDEEFQDTYARLERLPWTKLHVFPFSLRQGTAAQKLVDAGFAVLPEKIKARAKALRELSERKMDAAMKLRVGSVMEVLVEHKEVQYAGRTCSEGHSRSYYKVLLPGRQPANTFARVRIVGIAGKESLKGELI